MGNNEKMAKELAELHGCEVQEWMLWDGWTYAIGCELCFHEGPHAPCWGLAGCHGYWEGCACRGCASIDAENRKAADRLFELYAEEIFEVADRDEAMVRAINRFIAEGGQMSDVIMEEFRKLTQPEESTSDKEEASDD